jgi:phosphoserine phosphatase
MTHELLASWRPGATRDRLTEFLEASLQLPVEQRVAVFDNDGTLWVEKPSYPQFDFMLHTLAAAIADDPSLAEQPEFAAVLTGDMAVIVEFGLERIAMALTNLFAGATADEFQGAVRSFAAAANNGALGRPLAGCLYLPMLELVDELRRREFTVAIVTGGGTEFVRAISQQYYGVAPELVVGTLIDYDAQRDATGTVSIRRANRLAGDANEGMAKVASIQRHLGRRPILAAGNSGGDREMLEWALTGSGPGLALLIDHDDETREFAYVSSAASFTETEPITDVGKRLGFTIASMRDDWTHVFS